MARERSNPGATFEAPVPRRAKESGSCQYMVRRKATGKVSLNACGSPGLYDGQCAKHYIVYLHELLHEREQHVAQLTSTVLVMRRTLITNGHDMKKLMSGSLSVKFDTTG